MILDSHDLLDSSSFAYRDSHALGSINATIFLERGLDQQEGSSDGDVVIKGESSKDSDSEKSDLKLSLFMTQTGFVSEDN